MKKLVQMFADWYNDIEERFYEGVNDSIKEDEEEDGWYYAEDYEDREEGDE